MTRHHSSSLRGPRPTSTTRHPCQRSAALTHPLCRPPVITHPQPVQSAADLRPARRQPGLTITDVANALGYGITKIPRIERGHIRDTRFLHEYRDWLTSQQPLRTAA